MKEPAVEIGANDNMAEASGPVVLTEQQLDEVAGGINLKDLVLACPGCTSGGNPMISNGFRDVINPAVNSATLGGMAGGFR